LIQIARNHFIAEGLSDEVCHCDGITRLWAADVLHPHPPPPAPVVGKALIGKIPVGTAPIGKYPIGKSQPIATKG
jgi:hypothetical protein